MEKKIQQTSTEYRMNVWAHFLYWSLVHRRQHFHLFFWSFICLGTFFVRISLSELTSLTTNASLQNLIFVLFYTFIRLFDRIFLHLMMAKECERGGKVVKRWGCLAVELSLHPPLTLSISDWASKWNYSLLHQHFPWMAFLFALLRLLTTSKCEEMGFEQKQFSMDLWLS